MFIDNVSVGPTNLAFGTIVTDWEEFTPTGSWTTNVNYSGSKRRVGDSMEIRVEVKTSGLTDATNLLINIPDNLQIDNNKLPVSAFNLGVLGFAHILDVGVAHKQTGTVIYSSTSDVAILGGSSGSPENNTNITNVQPFTFNLNDSVVVEFSVPIQGWSSNTQMSEDLGGRDVIVTGAGNSGAAITANTKERIDFKLLLKTLTASWSSASCKRDRYFYSTRDR